MRVDRSAVPDVRRALLGSHLAIMPVGAIEPYGPHLPMGTDGIVALAVAERVAQRVPSVVLPLIPIGCSQMFSAFPGTLWVQPYTLLQYLRDVCMSVIRHGAKNLLIINGHLGNVSVIDDLCGEVSTGGVRCAQVDLWRFAAPLCADFVETGPLAGSHAGEIATSIVMALGGELVYADRLVPHPHSARLMEEFMGVRVYDQIAPSTSDAAVGDPTKASAHKGSLILDRISERIESFLEGWLSRAGV